MLRTFQSKDFGTSALLLDVDDVSGLVNCSRRLLLLRLDLRKLLVQSLKLSISL